jgi:hypothetical protein
MTTSLEQTILRHLAAYVAGTTSLDEFEDWLIGVTWNIEQANDPAATDLAYDIELFLAEQSTENFSEAELREMLRPLVETAAVPAT